MNRILSSAGLTLYVLIAFAALAWWAPHFFSANQHTWPQFNYRYIAATGVPLALLMMTVAARQSLMPRFSLVLALQVVAACLMLVLGIVSFQYLPQSVFFCAAHIMVCGASVLLNLFQYRRELAAWQKRRAAMSA